MNQKIKKTTALFVLLYSITLFAGVNLKNGNFYISYTDIVMESSYTAFKDITRTYNSKSTLIGLFGYGWGSPLETFLHSYPDGTVVIFEYGAGGKTIFTSELATDDMLDYMIDQLIEISIAQGDLDNTPNAIIQKRDELRDKHHKRVGLWDKYAKKGLLSYESDFPIGMEWESHQKGNELVIKMETGFKRKKANVLEEFNTLGKLTKLVKGIGQWSTIEYINGHIAKILHADGSAYLITTNEEGFVSSISYNDDKATFKYKGKNLVLARSMTKNYYKFDYDVFHNLTRINYNPIRLKGTPEDSQYMEYEPKTSFISKITDRNGAVIEYKYDFFYHEDGSVDDNHYATNVIKTVENGEKATNTYEYFIGVKENGEQYTQKTVKTIRGYVTSTIYDELCNSPIEIIRGNRKTTFKYNNRCLLTEKISNRDSIYMKYHPKLEKLIYVKNKNGVTNFEYNDNANLTYAKNDDGVWAKLIYNKKGKIIEMQQEDKVLVFKYNEKDQPIIIESKGVGTVNITYDKYGEIERVSSEDGHKIALKVTQAFQNLLALVKPAGVNLNM